MNEKKARVLWSVPSERLVDTGSRLALERSHKDPITGALMWTEYRGDEAIFRFIGAALMGMPPMVIWTDGETRITNGARGPCCFPIERKSSDLIGEDTWLIENEEGTQTRTRDLIMEHGPRILRERAK